MIKKVAIIAAISRNNVIGQDGYIPWRLKSDMRRFKDLTTGNAVIMGRKTWDSLPSKFQPLPDRLNIVLSRSLSVAPSSQVILARDLDEALGSLNGHTRAFVMGGEEIYRLALRVAEEMYLTRVLAEVEGDVFFPPIPPEWILVEKNAVTQGESDDYPFSFERYRRIGH